MNQMQNDAKDMHAHVDELNLPEFDYAQLSKDNASKDCVKTQKTSPLFASDRSDKCTHDYSVMPASHPNSFIRFPYRPAVMNLLRLVETYDVDSVATEHGTDKPRVYASFQNHWSPNVNVPVLSIVGACNTVISPPTFRRRKFDWANITVMASSSQMQHDVSFKIPLILDQEKATKHVVMEMIRASDIGDHMTQYIIHPQDLYVPLLIVKIWNLSRYGCNKLHLASTYLAPRANTSDEMHVFGLSGDRETAYKIEYASAEDFAMCMLNEEDLIAIGYRAWDPPKPTFPQKEEEDSLEDHTKKNLMARMSPVEKTYISKGTYRLAVIPTKQISYIHRRTPSPLYYPPKNKFRAGYTDKKPNIFPTGYYSFRDVFMKRNATVRDVCNDLQKARGRKLPSAAQILASHCGIPVKLVLENFSSVFRNFIQKHKPKTTPEDFDLQPYIHQKPPKDWIHAKQHEVVSDPRTLVATAWKGQEYQFKDDADEDLNEDLIEDEIVRRNKLPLKKREIKWFPNQPTSPAAAQEEDTRSSDSEWTAEQINESMMQLEKERRERQERMKHIIERQKRLEEKERERTPMRIVEVTEAEIHAQPTPVEQDIPEEPEEYWKSLNEETYRKKAHYKKRRNKPSPCPCPCPQEKETDDGQQQKQKEDSIEIVSPTATLKPRKKHAYKQKQGFDIVNTQREENSPKKMPKKDKRAEMTKEEHKALIDGIINADPIFLSQLNRYFHYI